MADVTGRILDLAGEVYNVQHPDFGAAGDGSTNDAPAIQEAIDAAGDAGGGIVWIPPTEDGYLLQNPVSGTQNLPLRGRDNVTVLGAGYGSRLILPSPYSTQVFRLGGYEGSEEWYPWPVWDASDPETYDATTRPWKRGDPSAVIDAAARGDSSVTASTPADVSGWQAGDIVFLRTDAHEPYLFPYTNGSGTWTFTKELPYSSEMNEIVSVNGTTGEVVLRYPLTEDYAEARIYRSEGRLDRTGREVAVLRRFRVQGLRIVCETKTLYTAIFTFGGLWESEFRDLWLEGADLFMLNAIARCRFENIHGRFWGRFGEVSYLSHHNVFRDVRASYHEEPLYVPGNGQTVQGPKNGLAVNEGAHDNTFDHLLLNYGSNPNWPLILSGKRNRLRKSTVIAPDTQYPAVTVAYPTHEYKPEGCSVEECDLVIGRAGGTTAPRFAIEVDAGGATGGGCTVRGNRVYGEPKVAMISLTRHDLTTTGGYNDGTARNVVEGNVHVSSHPTFPSEAPVSVPQPVLTGVVEFNHAQPTLPTGGGGGTPEEAYVQKVIDPAFRPGDDLIRDNQTPLRQKRVDEVDLGTFEAISSTVLLPIRAYVIPRYSVGTQHRWRFEARGRFASSTSGRYLRLRIGTDGGSDPDTGVAQILGLNLPTGQDGSWRITADLGSPPQIYGAVTGEEGIHHADTSIGRKRFHWRTELSGATPTLGTAEFTYDSNDTAIRVVLTLHADVGGEEVTVDEWRVTPEGDEWSYINWLLVKDRNGGSYPSLSYP